MAQPKPPSPWDYVRAITHSGADVGSDEMPGYVPWVVNRALSRHPAYIQRVAMVNTWYFLGAQQQFEYLLFSLPRDRAWRGWIKADKDDPAIIGFAKEFDLSLRDARDYWKLLPEDVREQIACGDDNAGPDTSSKDHAEKPLPSGQRNTNKNRDRTK